MIDGQQERYLSYYGIKRAIKDGATLEVHYLRDKVPFIVDEKALNVGFERMCEEMELEDEEAKDLIQRRRSQWKELARHPDRVEIVTAKMLEHFLAYPDPSGFKAQLVGVDRVACARFKDAAWRPSQTSGSATPAIASWPPCAPSRTPTRPRCSRAISRAWNVCGRPYRPTPACMSTVTSTTGCAASTSPTVAASPARPRVQPSANSRPRPVR